MTMTNGAPLTAQQKKLCAENIACLQYQATFGNEPVRIRDEMNPAAAAQ
jgi:hypothetical protein